MSNATIRVQFNTPGGSSGGQAPAHLSAEIDSREGGLNAGKTSFTPGQTAYLLVYKSTNVVITDVTASAGSCTAGNVITVPLTDELTFFGEVTSSLGVPCKGSITATKWLGANLGSLTIGADQMTVTASGSGKNVGVAKVTYDADATVYALTSPIAIDGETDFTIVVLITGDIVV